jgi:pimeloyl-ACP methyl ester carboxylesterase
MEVAVKGKAPGRWERFLVAQMVRTVLRWQPRPRTQAIVTGLAWEPVAFEGNSGARIAGRWFAANKAVGTVVLAHPDRRLGQQWFLANGYVEFLLDAQYNVLTFDFAGYGDSRGGSTYLFEDLVAAVHEARTRASAPVHIWGVSIGAFSAANAAPHVGSFGALILESPFPTFNAWYGRRLGKFAMHVFDFLFPRTARLIQADANVAKAGARRILVVAADGDRVTPASLSQVVADAAPRDRTQTLRLNGVAHLRLFEESPEYRAAVIRVLQQSA